MKIFIIANIELLEIQNVCDKLIAISIELNECKEKLESIKSQKTKGYMLRAVA